MIFHLNFEYDLENLRSNFVAYFLYVIKALALEMVVIFTTWLLSLSIFLAILLMCFLNFVFRNYKREAELARMSWKIKPEDLLPTHLGARGQFGSRYSLGRLSLPVMKKDVS